MSYLVFVRQAQVGRGRKTLIVRVVSAQHGDTLGVIKWFGRWRQYAFFPEPGSVWNPDCLTEVNAQIRALMAARRAGNST